MLDGERCTKRCQRWNYAGHAHELNFNCYLNRPFLSRERTCGYLIRSINTARRKCEFDLWAYVFMPNHVHLVIHPRCEIYSISDILLAIKQPVSRKAIAYVQEHNPAGLHLLATGQRARPYRFWQKGGGYDRNITTIDILIETIRYIHNNPVRKGLVQTPDQWHYSSATDWEGSKSGPLPVDFDSFPAH
jgi:putative transposase